MALEPDFEEKLLQRRLADLSTTAPAHADLVRNLLGSLDYNRATIKDRNAMRHMVFSLGSKLAKDREGGVSSWQGWLERLASDGALSASEAQVLIARAQALQPKTAS